MPRLENMVSRPGTPELFNDHPVVRSRNLEEARVSLSNAFLPVELSVRKPRPAVDVRLNVVRVGRITAGYLRFGEAVRVRTAEATNYHVDIPMVGSMVTRSGLREPVLSNPRTATVFPPSLPAELDCDDECAQVCLMLPRSDVRTELENLLGRPITKPLAPATSTDLTGPNGAAFVQLLNMVDLESRRPDGLLGHRLAAQRVEQLLIDSFIFGHSHNYSEAIRASQPATGVRPISYAVELLRSDPGRPWTATELAQAVSVSVRSLHDGFRRSVGTSPMAYLRELRLEAVRAELAAAEPGELTVTGAATRWGFLHLGRFAATYRRRFGELPSETLRSAPPRGAVLLSGGGHPQ